MNSLTTLALWNLGVPELFLILAQFFLIYLIIRFIVIMTNRNKEN